MTMRADVAELDQPYRAKRTGQSKAEYANPYERYTRPVTWKTWALWLIAAALLAGAMYLGAR